MNDALERLFVFVCTAHIMKNAKKHAVLQKGNDNESSQQHFVMRFFGRLINCSTLQEATVLVKAAYIVLKSKGVTPDVSLAVKDLEKAINDFSNEIELSMDEIQSAEKEAEEKRFGFKAEEEELLIANKTSIKEYWRSKLDPLAPN